MFKRFKNQKGAIAVMASIITTALLGFTACAVDIGMVITSRNQLQNAADSAALAAASKLDSNALDATTTISTAKTYASYNNVLNQPVALQDGDIQITDNQDKALRRVKVTAYRTSARGNPVNLMFAKVLGFNSVDVVASSRAGLIPVRGTNGIRPWAVRDRCLESGGGNDNQNQNQNNNENGNENDNQNGNENDNENDNGNENDNQNGNSNQNNNQNGNGNSNQNQNSNGNSNQNQNSNGNSNQNGNENDNENDNQNENENGNDNENDNQNGNENGNDNENENENGNENDNENDNQNENENGNDNENDNQNDNENGNENGNENSNQNGNENENGNGNDNQNGNSNQNNNQNNNGNGNSNQNQNNNGNSNQNQNNNSNENGNENSNQNGNENENGNGDDNQNGNENDNENDNQNENENGNDNENDNQNGNENGNDNGNENENGNDNENENSNEEATPCTGYEYPAVGELVTMKFGPQNNEVEPYWFGPVCMPPANKGNPQTGANAYRDLIENGYSGMVEIGDTLRVEPGNMAGPTYQGVNYLVGQDPSAYWDVNTNKVEGSSYPNDQSPRIIKVVFYDPNIGIVGNPGEITVTRIGAFFLEGAMDEPNASVTGRFIETVSDGVLDTNSQSRVFGVGLTE